MITFEKITQDLIEVIEEITNSNQSYNLMENGRLTRTKEELMNEYFDSSTQTETYFIKLDDTYIGLVDFLKLNPKDGFPWLGLLMIHNDYQGYGFGTNAFLLFEELLLKRSIHGLRLGVLLSNQQAKTFWQSQGFTFVENRTNTDGIEVEVYEKLYS
ncbi:GNAT family N-acetyltransferase [Bacillus sp. AFS002410]|uniref:GNAT family N-acetyltransferase n=1 Tax=Bacillus sp. AFS002410 TaxID=2033481 RepID=UPI000BF089AF|nr:GNAT family N-acetyltransferase [Bacillus sp. AFS002410]PEJ56648.1 GNAT family N-acetyltransferase [Bacillus sp. AFS002410]